MKRTVLALVTLLLAVNSFAIVSWPTDSWPIASWPETCQIILSNENVTDDDGWILVGEVRLYPRGRGNAKGELIADLYIREVANKIIYRIKYNETYYAVQKSNSDEKGYFATIGDGTYYFEVQ